MYILEKRFSQRSVFDVESDVIRARQTHRLHRFFGMWKQSSLFKMTLETSKTLRRARSWARLCEVLPVQKQALQ